MSALGEAVTSAFGRGGALALGLHVGDEVVGLGETDALDAPVDVDEFLDDSFVHGLDVLRYDAGRHGLFFDETRAEDLAHDRHVAQSCVVHAVACPGCALASAPHTRVQPTAVRSVLLTGRSRETRRLHASRRVWDNRT